MERARKTGIENQAKPLLLNLAETEEEIDCTENQTRRSNLHIHGIQGSPAESWKTAEEKVEVFISEKLKFTSPTMEIELIMCENPRFLQTLNQEQ